MAVGTPVLLGNNSAVNSSADLAVTLSGTITNGAMAFCAVVVARNDSTNPAAPTGVSGGGGTWTLDKTYAYDTGGVSRASLFLYRSYVATGSGTTVTVDLAEEAEGVVAAVLEVEGCATGGTNGANAVHATNIGQATGSTNLVEAAMATLSTANSAYLAIAAYRATVARTWTPDAAPALTEVLDYASAISAASIYTSLHLSYRLAGGDTNPTIGATTSGGITTNAILVLELVEAVGPSIDTQPTAQTARINGESAGPIATFTVAATSSGGSLVYDWELEDGVASGVYANVADGNGATWTGVTGTSLVGTFTATTLTGRRVRCNVTDDNGTVTTNAVALTVMAGPVTTASDSVTSGSGVGTLTYHSDDALTTNGELLLWTVTSRGRSFYIVTRPA